ncbi:MAG: SusC/RagA family TonB-linked outer membrane protein [Breznakibacter sp.]
MKLKIITIFLFCLWVPNSLLGQAGGEMVVQGTVTSKTDGETIMAVNVTEVDANNRIVNATITDINGKYIIKVKNVKNKLVFSVIGFVTQSRTIDERRTVNVALEEDVQMLGEAVIKAERLHNDGTFSISQREVSTAVQRIDTKEFEGLQVTSIDDALQGRIAGLDIVANSGDLGSGTSMRIRGTSSINANQEPLIVMNGIPYEVTIDPSFDFASANQEQYANMLSINPDDIQEITVLKDAASTAVWGSKGANGVIMITTKKGAKGPTRVQYTYRLTQARYPKGMNLLNGDEYTMMMKQALFNRQQDESEANRYPELMYSTGFTEYENFNNNIDWVDAVSQIGFTNDHYLTVSGGGDRARFRVSGGYLTQTGTVIGQKLDRFTTRAYLDYSVSDRIKFISEFSFTYSDNDRNWSSDATDNDKLTLLGIAYRKMPNVSIYKQDIYGNNTDEYYNILRSSTLHDTQRDLRNPVALANLGTNNLKNYRILPTFRLQYDLLDPMFQTLRYNMYVSFDMNNNKTSKFLPREASSNTWDSDYSGLSESADSESMTVMADNNITWYPRFVNKDHNLQMYGSFQIRTGNTVSQGIALKGISNSGINDASVSGYMNTPYSSRSSYRSMGLLGRLHYSYKGRYILGATLRRDGSTKFGDERKWGNFPGISLRWNISDEPFMAGTESWLSMLAIRPSWGMNGNEPSSEYLHYSRYGSYGSYAGYNATRPTSLRLSDLKWETTTATNLGVDLALFDDKFVFDLNYYKKRTEDLLFKDLAVSATSGYTTVAWQNVGTMDNEGWELNFLTNRAIKVNKLTIDFNFNLSNYVNTIVELRDDVLDRYNNEYSYKNGEYLTRLQENNSYGSIYGFRYKGVYQYNDYVPGVQENAPVARDKNNNVIYNEDGTPLPMYFAYHNTMAYQFKGGDAIYEDINHDGNIDELDIVYLGNANPKINGGFGSVIRYKNFQVSAFFNFRYGNKIVNAARMNAENMYSFDNQSKAVNYRWRKDGDVTNMPRALYDYGYNWLGSDRYVEDGSFVRFKYLTFNYSVPQAMLKKYGLSQLSFYLTINNLYVWTKYTGVDPEVGYGDWGLSKDTSKTPRPKDFTLGVTAAF